MEKTIRINGAPFNENASGGINGRYLAETRFTGEIPLSRLALVVHENPSYSPKSIDDEPLKHTYDMFELKEGGWQPLIKGLTRPFDFPVVVIGSDVKEVLYGEFRTRDNLKAVYSMSDTVGLEIGAQAFADCPSLEKVDIGAATNIGELAFANCDCLKAVEVPNAEKVGRMAFINDRALSSLNMPSDVEMADDALKHTRLQRQFRRERDDLER